jgi:hypothetical protein
MLLILEGELLVFLILLVRCLANFLPRWPFKRLNIRFAIEQLLFDGPVQKMPSIQRAVVLMAGLRFLYPLLLEAPLVVSSSYWWEVVATLA